MGLGSGPKSGSGLIRWYQSGERILVWPLDPTRTALPLIGTGTQQTLGPDSISCLWPDDRKKMANWKEKDRPHQKNTSKPNKKKSELLFYLLLLLLLPYTFLFNDLKASN